MVKHKGRPRKTPLAPFGLRLRAAIEASDRFESRAQFLKEFQLDGATVGRYENGTRRPSSEFLEICAANLPVTIDELLGVATVDPIEDEELSASERAIRALGRLTPAEDTAIRDHLVQVQLSVGTTSIGLLVTALEQRLTQIRAEDRRGRPATDEAKKAAKGYDGMPPRTPIGGRGRGGGAN